MINHTMTPTTRGQQGDENGQMSAQRGGAVTWRWRDISIITSACRDQKDRSDLADPEDLGHAIVKQAAAEPTSADVHAPSMTRWS